MPSASSSASPAYEPLTPLAFQARFKDTMLQRRVESSKYRPSLNMHCLSMFKYDGATMPAMAFTVAL